MTNKTILGSALMLILIIPTTSLSAFAIAPDEPTDGKQFKINVATTSSLSPLVNKLSNSYHGLYSGVTIKSQTSGNNYVAYQYTKKTINLGTTDTPLGSTTTKSVTDPLTFPVSEYPVAVVYNLLEFKQSGLKLTGPVLADIYLGKITYWNDKRISDLNPGVALPTMRITPIHRSDESGATFTFTDYLSQVSKDWKNNIGKGTKVNWRVGPDVPEKRGSDGVAMYVARTPYSIAYLELTPTIKNKLTYAAIQNADRTAYVTPTLEASTSAAASVASKLPESFQGWSDVSIANAPGKNSYPIVGFNYILTYTNLDKVKGLDKDTAKTIVHLIYWTITDAESFQSKLQNAPLPDSITEIDKRGLAKINFKGTQLFSYDGFVIQPIV